MMLASLEEIMTYMGLNAASVSAADQALIDLIQPGVESRIKAFVGYNVVMATYEHLLPDSSLGGGPGALGLSESRASQYLFLPEVPVRTVWTIHEDPKAYGGQGADPWPASSLLTAGTHYYLDCEKAGYSRSGIVRRIGGVWSDVPRSIKVRYAAGYANYELEGEFYDFKLAALESMAKAFNEAKANSGNVDSVGSSARVISSESLADYSVSYADAYAAYSEANVGLQQALPVSAMRRLERWQRRRL